MHICSLLKLWHATCILEIWRSAHQSLGWVLLALLTDYDLLVLGTKEFGTVPYQQSAVSICLAESLQIFAVLTPTPAVRANKSKADLVGPEAAGLQQGGKLRVFCGRRLFGTACWLHGARQRSEGSLPFAALRFGSTWNELSVTRLMYVKESFVILVYMFSFMGSILFGIQQLRFYQHLDEQHAAKLQVVVKCDIHKSRA